MCFMICYGRREREIWVQGFRRGTERHLKDLSVDAAMSNSVKMVQKCADWIYLFMLVSGVSLWWQW